MKKTLCLFLVLTLSLGLTAIAFAAGTNAKITGMSGDLALGYSGSGGGYADLGEVYPQDERVEYIHLYDTMFSWDNGDVPVVTPSQLTPAQIRGARLDVRTAIRNTKVIDSVKLDQRESRIEVKFKDEYAGTKEIDFELDVSLTVDGKRQDDHGLTFTGTFTNPVIELYDGADTVDISDGSVALAVDAVSKLEADIGNGVTIKTRLSKDKRIYGVADTTPGSADDDLMNENKDISDVINLKTEGFNASSSTVKLGSEYRGLFVYDKDLAYLGKAGDDLPFLDKYYLSSKELESADDLSDGEDEPFEDPAENAEGPVSLFDDTYPVNVNSNPGTGR
jgi:hypothetical protein